MPLPSTVLRIDLSNGSCSRQHHGIEKDTDLESGATLFCDYGQTLNQWVFNFHLHNVREDTIYHPFQC